MFMYNQTTVMCRSILYIYILYCPTIYYIIGKSCYLYYNIVLNVFVDYIDEKKTIFLNRNYIVNCIFFVLVKIM